jgi:hypothetical protein
MRDRLNKSIFIYRLIKLIMMVKLRIFKSHSYPMLGQPGLVFLNAILKKLHRTILSPSMSWERNSSLGLPGFGLEGKYNRYIHGACSCAKDILEALFAHGVSPASYLLQIRRLHSHSKHCVP